MSQLKSKTKSKIPGKPAAKPKVPRAAEAERVPEEAENFEHTLRRLVIEKEKARKGNFGLYR